MLPRPTFNEPPEPFAQSDELRCDQTPKPGVEAWADFLVKNVGGRRGRIVGPCDHRSGHASGRAFDWMVNASDPAEKAMADDVIAWLLANDAEYFRRLGLIYLIWNKRIWGGLSQTWKTYGGFDEDGNCSSPPCRNAHTDHVHFSFHDAGAEGATSMGRWIAAQEGKPIPVQPPPSSYPTDNASLWWLPLGFGLGFFLSHKLKSLL